MVMCQRVEMSAEEDGPTSSIPSLMVRPDLATHVDVLPKAASQPGAVVRPELDSPLRPRPKFRSRYWFSPGDLPWLPVQGLAEFWPVVQSCHGVPPSTA